VVKREVPLRKLFSKEEIARWQDSFEGWWPCEPELKAELVDGEGFRLTTTYINSEVSTLKIVMMFLGNYSRYDKYPVLIEIYESVEGMKEELVAKFTC